MKREIRMASEPGHHLGASWGKSSAALFFMASFMTADVAMGSCQPPQKRGAPTLASSMPSPPSYSTPSYPLPRLPPPPYPPAYVSQYLPVYDPMYPPRYPSPYPPPYRPVPSLSPAPRPSPPPPPSPLPPSPSPPRSDPPQRPPPLRSSPPPMPRPNLPPPGTPSSINYAQSAYELLDQRSMVVAVHLVHIPGTDRYLYMERPSGYHPDGSHNIAGTLDLVTREWTHLDTPTGLFCCGHSLMANGSVIVMGGHVDNAGFPDGRWSVRTYTDNTPGLVLATNMSYPRWYPTVTLLPNKKVMVMGGTQGVGAGTAHNPYYEIWDPEVPLLTQKLLVLPAFLTNVKQNYFPFNYVLPSGDMFSYCARIAWIINPYTGQYKVPVPGRPLSLVARSVVYVVQYPFTGTSVMLPLLPENNYTVEIMVIGGQNVLATSNLNLTACSESLRIKISMPSAGNNEAYSFNGGWVTESMGLPRVMPDSVLLPNGVVILLNGAMEGLAGDAASGGGSKAYYPNFWAEMYQPYAPLGERWSTLARSQIPRLYHSNAVLTTNGTILVTGCDRCGKVQTNVTFSPSPAKAEYRNEIFYPPFWYDFKGKPRVVSAPSHVVYGSQFTVTYTGLHDPNVVVTSAVLVAPSSNTHGFNTNQRVVKLVMTASSSAKQLTLTAPPSPNHAPPQLYMLFLLNGQTYSSAVWVKLSSAT